MTENRNSRTAATGVGGYADDRVTAIVPVAGAGMRLRPHTHTYPKALLTVGDKPIIGHILDQLVETGIKKACLVTGYLGEKIKRYVSENYPSLNVSYAVQEEQLGLGHAIWLTKEYVKGPAFIILGDTIISADMRKFLNSEIDCIAVKAVDDPRRFGVVEIEKGYIKNIAEKPQNPKSKMAVVGIYSFKNCKLLYDSLDKLMDSRKTTKGEIQLSDALEILVKSGHKIKPVPIEGWHDCGKPETLLATNKYILDKKKFKIRRKNCLIIPPVYIADSAKAVNSVIGPYVSIGAGAKIESSVISDSIINENAIINNMNLSGSLVGPSAVVTGRREQINIGENSEINFNV
ncbi:MAG: nucleotidyl transferase [Elusimicrobia bacterium]|nr:nucleotidyl transferase [Elusimicrobiota bacterium]